MTLDMFHVELDRALIVYAWVVLADQEGVWVKVTKISVRSAVRSLAQDKQDIAARMHRNCLYIG